MDDGDPHEIAQLPPPTCCVELLTRWKSSILALTSLSLLLCSNLLLLLSHREVFIRDCLCNLCPPAGFLPGDGEDGSGNSLVLSDVEHPSRSGVSHKLMVGVWHDLHRMEPQPPKDCAVRRLHVNHVELRDDVVGPARTGSTIMPDECVSFSSNPYS